MLCFRFVERKEVNKNTDSNVNNETNKKRNVEFITDLL